MRAPLAFRWRLADGVGTMGMPVVQGEYVIAFQGEARDVRCLDLAGVVRWSLPGIGCAGAIADRQVLIMVQRSGRGLHLLLVDLESGRVDHEERLEQGSMVAVLSDGRSFLERSWPEPVISRRKVGPGMAVLWSRGFGTKEEASVDLRVAADGARCVLAVTAPGSGQVSVVAVDLETGVRSWSASVNTIDEPAGDMDWNPAITRELVVFNTCNSVVALRAADGHLAWQSPTAGMRTVYGDRVYVRGVKMDAPGQPSEIVALDLGTGRVVWRRHYPEVLAKARANRLTGYLAISETHIFSGDDTGTIWGFDATTGDPVWHHRAKGSRAFWPYAVPVVAGGRLYVTSEGVQRQMLCYEQTETAALSSATRDEPDEIEARVGFRIEGVHARQKLTRRTPYFAAGGNWTVLRCTLGKKGAFFLALEEGLGAGRLWVTTVDDGELLLEAIRKAFPVRSVGEIRPGSRVGKQASLDVAVLSSGVAETGAGKGAWTLSKWTGAEGVPELYVNWSVAEKRGAITEKDDSDRKALIHLVAGLLVR